MRRLNQSLVVVMVLIMALSLLAGCGQQANTPADQGENSLERVQSAGTLVVGLDDAFPPMGYRNDQGELIGFDIDFGEELAARLGVELEWQPTEWSGVVMALQSKRFDIILSGMSVTEERKEQVNFTTPYLATNQIIVVTSDNDTIKTLEDVEGKVVGSQLGSTGEAAAKNIPGVDDNNLKLYNVYTDAFSDLANGRLDALVVDEIVARHYMTKRPGEFKVTAERLEYEPFAIAVRKEDGDLLDGINAVIQEMREDGTFAQISEKWFGEDITKDVQ